MYCSVDRNELVNSLLDEGLSIRKIAAITRVSRDTVAIIRRIKLGLPTLKSSHIPKKKPAEPIIIYPDRRASYVLCPICRTKVKPPCLVCQIRKLPKTSISDD